MNEPSYQPGSSGNPADIEGRPEDTCVTQRPLIYACSGSSDAGELADRVARQLARDGMGEMSCLAGVAGRVKSLTAKAEKANRIIVIDGCPLACAKHTMRLAGFSDFEHVGLHEIGLRKGSCPATDERVQTAAEQIKERLARNFHSSSVEATKAAG